MANSATPSRVTTRGSGTGLSTIRHLSGGRVALVPLFAPRGRTGGGASGAGEPTLAGEAEFERGMMALGTDGGFHVLDKRIPHPLQLSGSRVRSLGCFARTCGNEQLGLIDLHQVKEPQVDSQLALLAQLGSADLLLTVECFKPALETGRVLASALRATVLLLHLSSKVA